MYRTTDGFKTERDLTVPVVVELYNNGNGLSIKEISELYHCSEGTVRNRIRKSGADIAPPRYGVSRTPWLRIRQAAFMYEELGMTATEIAEAMGFKHYSSAILMLRRASVPLRSRSANCKAGWESRRGTRPKPVERVKKVS